MNIISIDVGLKTLSLSKEKYDIDECSKLTRPRECFLKDLSCTREYLEYVNNVAAWGELVHLEKVCLGEKKDYFAGKAFQNLYAWLDKLELEGLFADDPVVLIEQQMKTNNVALALMHHIHAWLLIRLEGKIKVILYQAKNKTRVLGMPLKLENKKGALVKASYAQRKKWSVSRCREILDSREAHEKWTEYIFVANKKKADDLCDTVLQCLSYVLKSLEVRTSKKK
jgi:hypothetical protein